METKPVDGLTLFFDPQDRDAADLIADACRRSVALIRECWGLERPKRCRVYVLRSFLHFMFHPLPWRWRILMGALLPFWYSRLKKMWAFVGGWTLPRRNRPAVGVKPPRLLETTDRRIGARIYIKEEDVRQKVDHIACHELVHAFTAHLKLPMWLNEGLAMVTVDRFFGAPVVKPGTVELLACPPKDAGPGKYRNLLKMDDDTVVYHYVRGYWITRYLEETRPGFVKGLLTTRRRHPEIERTLAEALGIDHKELWKTIDGVVAAYFLPEHELRSLVRPTEQEQAAADATPDTAGEQPKPSHRKAKWAHDIQLGLEKCSRIMAGGLLLGFVAMLAAVLGFFFCTLLDGLPEPMATIATALLVVVAVIFGMIGALGFIASCFGVVIGLLSVAVNTCQRLPSRKDGWRLVAISLAYIVFWLILAFLGPFAIGG